MEEYILIPWPEVQKYMDEDWFEQEACLANDELFLEHTQIGNSAYFIPKSRINSL